MGPVKKHHSVWFLTPQPQLELRILPEHMTLTPDPKSLLIMLTQLELMPLVVFRIPQGHMIRVPVPDLSLDNPDLRLHPLENPDLTH